MPPRFVYWTILIDSRPTAFRAAQKEDLLPTLAQLQRTNKDVVLKYFARGRLWNSAEEARVRDQRPQEKRGREWRPGGTHRDPRDQSARRKEFKRDQRPERKPDASEERPPRQERRDGQKDGPHKPWQTRPRPNREGRPWPDKPGSNREAKPWHNKPGSNRDAKPWHNKPRPNQEGKPWQEKPKPRGDRRPSGSPFKQSEGREPWKGKPKPFGERRPWQGKSKSHDSRRPPWQGKPGGKDQPPRPWQKHVKREDDSGKKRKPGDEE